VEPRTMRTVGNALANLAGLASMGAAVAVAAVIMPGFGMVEVSITWFDTALAILLLLLAVVMVLVGFVLVVVSLFMWRRKSTGRAFRVLGAVWAIVEVAILSLSAPLWIGYLSPSQAARPFAIAGLVATAIMLPVAILLMVAAGFMAGRAAKMLQAEAPASAAEVSPG
jgi:hypothetical protein